MTLPVPFGPHAELSPSGVASAGATASATKGTRPLRERELTALWLLGRTPAEVLPAGWTPLRPGRAGRGPGPDIREATFRCESGAVIAGAVEVHLRASDFVRHGHDCDPNYAGVRLHLVWEDDRALPGAPLALPGGGSAPTVEVAPALRYEVQRLRRLVARGPSGREPCSGLGRVGCGEGCLGGCSCDQGWGLPSLRAVLRGEGRRRLAERVWSAGRLVERRGWHGAWERLLERAIRASAGRRSGQAQPSAAALTSSLIANGSSIVGALRTLALAGRPQPLIDALRGEATWQGEAAIHEPTAPLFGRARAAEIGWNAALPLLIAAATAYDDAALAQATVRLAEHWPAPRPYGRTAALRAQLLEGCPPLAGGALAAQGLLHVQDLWCERGGCGVCPLSR